MKIGILGTGIVGQTIGSALIKNGHDVKMGSRTNDNPKALDWVAKSGSHASNGTFADAASFGEIVFNCTKGENTLDALKLAGSNNLKGKILIDISNSLDFSKGMPPTLTIVNDNSLGEEVQKLLPDTKVVKTLNTLTCSLMVNPKLVNNGDHDIFVCGNDPEARSVVTTFLSDNFGWESKHIIDLGDITNSRGTEQLLPIWIRLMQNLGTANFQFKIVK